VYLLSLRLGVELLVKSRNLASIIIKRHKNDMIIVRTYRPFYKKRKKEFFENIVIPIREILGKNL
jgi:hypothetical protein